MINDAFEVVEHSVGVVYFSEWCHVKTSNWKLYQVGILMSMLKSLQGKYQDWRKVVQF